MARAGECTERSLLILGISQVGKAHDFDSCIRGFESRIPSQKKINNLCGEVSEWFKELVLKTSDVVRHRGFESHPLRHL